jgi:putative membrane protein
MLLGILIGVLGISYLLEHYPSLIWGFFFGLIIASAIYIGRKISNWTYIEILATLIGAGIAYYITVVSPSQGTENLLFVFVSGMIAICALILPGISGSFILLLMGMYTIVLQNARMMISEQNIHSMALILVFLLGCGAGVTLFSNVLNYLFKRFYHPTLALLTGFMIGSLNRIWPWRNPITWLDKQAGDYVNIIPPGSDLHQYQVVQEMNVLPNNYEGTAYLPGVIICFLLGLVIVWLLDRNDRGQEAEAQGIGQRNAS